MVIEQSEHIITEVKKACLARASSQLEIILS